MQHQPSPTSIPGLDTYFNPSAQRPHPPPPPIPVLRPRLSKPMNNRNNDKNKDTRHQALPTQYRRFPAPPCAHPTANLLLCLPTHPAPDPSPPCPNPLTFPIQLHIDIPLRVEDFYTQVRTEELHTEQCPSITLASLQEIISCGLAMFDLRPKRSLGTLIVLRTVWSAVNPLRTPPRQPWQIITSEGAFRKYLLEVIASMQLPARCGSTRRIDQEVGYLCPCGCGERSKVMHGRWVAQLEVKIACL